MTSDDIIINENCITIKGLSLKPIYSDMFQISTYPPPTNTGAMWAISLLLPPMVNLGINLETFVIQSRVIEKFSMKPIMNCKHAISHMQMLMNCE